MRFLQKIGLDWRIILSGSLIIFAAPPFHLSPLVWFAMVPWLHFLDEQDSWKKSLLGGMWFSFIVTVGSYYWVAFAIHHFGHLPWAISIVGLLLFALFNQIQLITFSLAYCWAKKRYPIQSSILFLGVAFTAIDWLLPKLFLDTFGHILFNRDWIRQVADVGGAAMLTFLVFIFNKTVAVLIRDRTQRLQPAIVLGLLFAANLYGVIREGQIQEMMANPEKTVKAAMIQGNIGNFDKVAAETGARQAGFQVLDQYIRLSDEAILQESELDFIVWPETAYPSTYGTPWTTHFLTLDRKLENFVRSRGIPLLFGGYHHENKKDYNSLFSMDPMLNKKPDVYHKHVLLPFGEYIPGFGPDSIFKKLFPNMGFFGRGPGPQVFKLDLKNGRGEVRFAPMICYEALVTNYGIGGARHGNQVFVNVTNDSWFGTGAEPWLHLALTVFRSIETRAPQIRSTNTGVSALILPDGEMVNMTAIGEEKVEIMNIPINSPPQTLYVKWGDWFGPFCIVLLILISGYYRFARRPSKD